MWSTEVTTPTVYAVPTERTSPIWCAAFAKGCGGKVVTDRRLREGPVALWGSPLLWPLLQQTRAENRTWYYGDKGYYGRGEYYRITRNAFMHDGIGDYPPDRFRRFGLQMQPWVTAAPWRATRHIVICPNSPAHFSLFGLTVEQWLGETIATLSQHTDRPIRVRWKSRQQVRSFADDLQGAWAVVVWSSNAAVEAIVAGVPVFVLAPHAAAYRMGSQDLSQIERPRTPSDAERQRFLFALAYQQWALEEIASGQAWRELNQFNIEMASQMPTARRSC